MDKTIQNTCRNKISESHNANNEGFSSVKVAVNLVGFQIIWWLMILYQDQYVSIGLLLLIGHLMLIKEHRCESVTLLAVGFIGTLVDSALTLGGVFEFTQNSAVGGIVPIPLWLITLWFGFAATLRHSMSYLSERLLLAGIFGGIGGPLSYVAGERLGAVNFGFSLPVVVALLAAIWALLLPLAFVLVRRLEGRFSSVKIFHNEA